MKVLNVQRVDEWAILVEDHCDPPPGWDACRDNFAAYHPFKDVTGFQQCMVNARSLPALATTGALESTSALVPSGSALQPMQDGALMMLEKAAATGSVEVPASVPQQSCATYGCVSYNPTHVCQCNIHCREHNSCCSDYAETCANTMV